MKLIILNQKGGKTRLLINKSAETGYYMVVINHAEAIRVSDVARKMGLNIPFPISFDEFIARNFYPQGIKGFLIDNADYLLRHMARGVDIDVVTWTQLKEKDDQVEEVDKET